MNRGSASRRKPAVHDRMFGRLFPDWSREGVVGSEETIMLYSNKSPASQRDPWNKGRLIGQKDR